MQSLAQVWAKILEVVQRGPCNLNHPFCKNAGPASPSLAKFADNHLQVWVKILEVRQEGPGNYKLAASRRAVDQDSGADLDPDNLLAQRKTN